MTEIDLQALRAVVQRVVAEQLRKQSDQGPAPSVARARDSATEIASGHLRLSGSPITLAALREPLTEIRTVTVDRRAVITPAVIDRLRSLGIALQRGASEASPPGRTTPSAAASSKPSTAIADSPKTNAWRWVMPTVLASARWDHPVIAADTPGEVLTALASAPPTSHQPVIAVTAQPYEVVWQAIRQHGWRAAVLSSLSDLDEVWREAPPELLVVSSVRWNLPMLRNLVRRAARRDGA